MDKDKSKSFIRINSTRVYLNDHALKYQGRCVFLEREQCEDCGQGIQKTATLKERGATAYAVCDRGNGGCGVEYEIVDADLS